MDLVLICFIRSKPRRETEWYNSVLTSHIGGHSTHKYFTLLNSMKPHRYCMKINKWSRICREPPQCKAHSTAHTTQPPARTSASLRFQVPKFILPSFTTKLVIATEQPRNNQRCNSFQRRACKFTSSKAGNPEQPQCSRLSAQREPRWLWGFKGLSCSYHEQLGFLQRAPKPFLLPQYSGKKKIKT